LADLPPEKSLETVKGLGADHEQVEPSPADIRIVSRHLAKLLLSPLCDFNVHLAGLLEMVRPYKHLIFHYGRVKEATLRQQAILAIDKKMSLLEELCYYMEAMKGIMAYYNKLNTLSALDNAKILYNNIYHLFKPSVTILYPNTTTNPCVLDYTKLRRSQNPDQKL
jgi:hypothetical protein